MHVRRAALPLLLAAALGGPAPARAQAGGILFSRHNLSVTGPGSVRSTSETEVCVFCHVGHGGTGLGQNRPDPTAAYSPYTSSTMTAAPASPAGASRICLSCHDGTIALGMTRGSGRLEVANTGAGGVMPDGRARIGTNLRSTHPVSLPAGATPRTVPPPPGDPVRLDRGGLVQCTSCHDPHREDADPVVRKFLAKPGRSGALCATCHRVPFWTTNPSVHAVSAAYAGGAAAGAYPTVAENACASCHVPHHASGKGRLARPGDGTDDGVCLRCHDGTAGTRIDADLAKSSRHRDPRPDASAHDAGESPDSAQHRLPEDGPTAPRHVVCVDCHDPHAAFERVASAPHAPGALSGVWGIDRTGERVEAVRFEYEVCFKCHGASANQPADPLAPVRASASRDLLAAFARGAISFHPVVEPGRNPDVPGLRGGLGASSYVYCTDCHASDSGPGAGGTGPAGPHGSAHPFLLERGYSTTYPTLESPAAYALCYKCHERQILLSDASGFVEHDRHVQRSDQGTPLADPLAGDDAPCSVCHDAHGVPALAAGPGTGAHLVDFDVNVVSTNAGGERRYESTGPRSGTCNLSCHGVEHVNRSYAATPPSGTRRSLAPLRGRGERPYPAPVPRPR
jgi:predicted CXXCH cytochrome family protein